MKQTVLFLISLFYFVTGYSQFSPGYYALKDVSVIDGVSDKPLDHYTVIIHNNLIEAVGPSKEVPIPDSAEVFNYSGEHFGLLV